MIEFEVAIMVFKQVSSRTSSIHVQLMFTNYRENIHDTEPDIRILRFVTAYGQHSFSNSVSNELYTVHKCLLT